jgi:RNA polymerase sigma-70 factor (ECF subfamily)
VDEAPELLQRWRAGDATAGDALLRGCFTSLHRFFANKVNDGVDDLIQRTLLDCLEGADAIRDPEQFRAYMFTIARNRLFDRLRHECHVGRHVNLSDISLHELGASPSSVIAREERQRIVGEALRDLPLDSQLALELTYWEGLRAPEIALVLGLNANTVRARITRARDALRERLQMRGVLDDGPLLR